MSLTTLRAFLLASCISACPSAQTRTLALYSAPPRGLDLEAALVMHAELQRLLQPAGIDVVWKSLADRKAGETYDLVAVTSFGGSCAADEGASTPAAASLADTSIVNGHILPFFRIDCTRVVGMMGRHVEPAVLGRALARIAAHEVYHIVGQTAEHQKIGVAKAAFSIEDLTATQFELDAPSLARMRPPSGRQPPEIADAGAGR
jgi:hypothetical protein